MPVNDLSFGPGGLTLVKSCEGCELNAYQDIRGIWTIGYGHTGPPQVESGQSITQDQADQFLLANLQTAIDAVNQHVTVPLNQNQFDALVDLVFNIGAGAFAASTLLRDLNNNDFDSASQQFLVWDHAGAQVSQGLENRRIKEQTLFNTPVADDCGPSEAP
jgi:lysozyme